MSTCHAKAGAKPSRIDGVVCNLEAAVMIKSCKVGKDEMIPTHSIVKIAVSRNAMSQKRSFVRSLPPLKKAFEANTEDELEKKGEEEKGQLIGKERQRYVKDKKGELNATIERCFRERKRLSTNA